MLRNQGLSRQQANAVLNSRFALNHKLSTETARASAPIGFLRSTSTKNAEPTERTIGFNQNKLHTELYGRNDNQKEKSLDHSQGAVKAPIGFVYAKSNSVPPNRLKSIGFTAAEDTIDVAYKLSLGFDYENSTFISVSNRKSMGFSIE